MYLNLVSVEFFIYNEIENNIENNGFYIITFWLYWPVFEYNDNIYKCILDNNI